MTDTTGHCQIYKITNLINGKQYIGQTWFPLKFRMKNHYLTNSGCIKLNNAINKYGKKSFKIELLIITHTQECADYWEQYFINRFNTIKEGYNIRQGGSRGKCSEESKKKMKDAYWSKSEEERKAISLKKSISRKGIKIGSFSIQARQNMSDAHKGKRKLNQDQINCIRKDKRTIRELAKAYNVSRHTINRIRQATYQYSYLKETYGQS